MKISTTRLIKIVFVIIAISGFFLACKKEHSMFNPDCSGTEKTFSSDVTPIIQISCAINSGCHGTGSGNGPGALTNFQQVFNARAEIRSAVASGHMPLNGSLTVAEKNAILCWIDNGAPNN
jgi:hypothetical protein